MSHTCHATGCSTWVSPEMFMCKRHWFMLPKQLRSGVWAAYRPGQCDDWKITSEYVKAAKAAIQYIADKEGVRPSEPSRQSCSPAGR